VTKKKSKSKVKLSNLSFDEALTRLIQTDPTELVEIHERVAKDAEKIERNAKEHFSDIRAGGRRFKRPFRP